jgi:hypothetical protein
MNPNFFNLSKRKKRDILSELLVGETSEGLVSKKELSALHKLIGNTQQVNSIHKKLPDKTKKIVLRKKKKEKKRKATHYLSEEVLKSLDSAIKEIRTGLPEKFRSNVSKSQIVDLALAEVLDEFENKGEKSRLVRNIIQKK